MFPDFYNNIYYGLKDKFFPGDRGGGGGVGDAGANVPVATDPGVLINNKVNQILQSKDYTSGQKLGQIHSLELANL